VCSDGGGRRTREKACELVSQLLDTSATGFIWEYPKSVGQLVRYS